MKRKRYTEEQLISFLKAHEQGKRALGIARDARHDEAAELLVAYGV